MTVCVPIVASGVAVAAAVRSTWSPCGLSMLSTITPFGERAKGHSYRATAGWFVVGATVGGATLGTVMAALAAGRPGRPPGADDAGAVALAAALVAAVSDTGMAGCAAAGPPPPGQRALARPLPALGLRRRLRMADRHRPGHLHHHRGRLPDVVLGALTGARHWPSVSAPVFGLVRGRPSC